MTGQIPASTLGTSTSAVTWIRILDVHIAKRSFGTFIDLTISAGKPSTGRKKLRPPHGHTLRRQELVL